jgi:hypothetical protein
MFMGKKGATDKKEETKGLLISRSFFSRRMKSG